MNIMRIIIIIVIVLIIILGIEFFVKIKKNENKEIDTIRKSLLTRISIITTLIIILGICSLINILLSHKRDIRNGIDNYNKNYYIEKYGDDLDSDLSIFPDRNNHSINASFSSGMLTYSFDTDGYIVLKIKYELNDFEEEVNRIKNLSITIKSSCKDNSDEYTNYIKYDEESYNYPAYIAVDGFDSTYEYCLINEDELEIIYVYLAYPNTNNSEYKEYLKKDKSNYSKSDTLGLYSMYNHSFDNGKSFVEFDDCIE